MKVNTGRVENKKKYTEEIEIVIKKFNDLKKKSKTRCFTVPSNL